MELTERVVDLVARAARRRAIQYPGTDPVSIGEAAILSIALGDADSEEGRPRTAEGIKTEVWEAVCEATRKQYANVSGGDRAHYSAGEVSILAEREEQRADPASLVEADGRIDLQRALARAPEWVRQSACGRPARGSAAWKARRAACVWLAHEMSGYPGPDVR